MTGPHVPAHSGVHRRDRIDPVMVHQWDGAPTLAGELFLILLNDGNGRLRVQNRVTSYILSAAMLLDLYAKQRITLKNMTVSVTAIPETARDPQYQPGDLAPR